MGKLQYNTNKMYVLVLGAGLSTNNMGVNVLAEGAIRCILKRWPEAKVAILDYGRTPRKYLLHVLDRNIEVRLINLRFSKKFYLPNNIALLLLIALMVRLVPSQRLKRRIVEKNRWLKQIVDSGIAFSLSGGDSFSDIYGMQRLIYVSLPEFLILALKKRLVLLPQTIGPFSSSVGKIMAATIMRNADRIYSRDKDSIGEVEKILGLEIDTENKLKFSYDVGFGVVPSMPSGPEIDALFQFKSKGVNLVGLNVSGLLYRGGYIGNNMFGLKVDYRKLVKEIIRFFLDLDNTRVVLVPHVLGDESHMESDVTACKEVYQCLGRRWRDKIFVLKEVYDHKEIKYLIGQCNFFLGSRMHACIAALSQNIPAVGIAYSRKFKGVYNSIGVGYLVADPRKLNLDSLMEIIKAAYVNRIATSVHLARKMTEVRKYLANLLADF